MSFNDENVSKGITEMKREVVPRQTIATTIGDALRKLAEDPGSQEGMSDLGTVLRPHEAIGVARLVIEERVKCARCSVVVPFSKAEGARCVGCAIATRSEEGVAI